MRCKSLVLLASSIVLGTMSADAAGEERPTAPSRALVALFQACEKKADVRADAFERHVKSALRTRAAWVVAVEASDASVRRAYAEQLAHGVGRKLQVVTAASVVGKYIGETEKNLSRLLAHAEQSGALLFFDEADALFGKRSEVKDAHDRYAGQAASTLPARLLEYPGIVVLGARTKATLSPRAALAMTDAIVHAPAKSESSSVLPSKLALPWQLVCRLPVAAPVGKAPEP